MKQEDNFYLIQYVDRLGNTITVPFDFSEKDKQDKGLIEVGTFRVNYLCF